MTREKLSNLMGEYGKLALGTYLVIWVVTLFGFATAISLGYGAQGAPSDVGLVGATWLATKLTQPLRIAGTLALTPIIAELLHKIRRQ